MKRIHISLKHVFARNRLRLEGSPRKPAFVLGGHSNDAHAQCLKFNEEWLACRAVPPMTRNHDGPERQPQLSHKPRAAFHQTAVVLQTLKA